MDSDHSNHHGHAVCIESLNLLPSILLEREALEPTGSLAECFQVRVSMFIV